MTHDEIYNLNDSQRFERLCEDFLERDGNTFVRVKRNPVLGWEDQALGKDGTFTSFFGQYASDEEVLHYAYENAKNTIAAMNVPQRVRISVIPGSNESATDEKTVWVATDYFDDKTLSPNQKADIFRGLAVHEGGHLLYTDWKASQQRVFAKKNQILSSLVNIIEDEREERCVGEDLPGLANFLIPVKEYIFGKKRAEMKANRQAMGKQENVVAEVVDTLLDIIRFPVQADPNLVKKHSALLLDIRDNVLTPYPETTSDAIDAAEKIFEMLKQYCKQELNGQNDHSEDAEEGEGEGDGEQVTVVIATGGGAAQEQGEPQPGQGQGSGAKGKTIVVTPGQDGSQSQGQWIDEKTMEKILDAVADAMKKELEGMNTSSDQMEGNQYEKNKEQNEKTGQVVNRDYNSIAAAKQMQGDIVAMGVDGIEIVKMKKLPQVEQLYRASYNRIKGYIPAVRRQLSAHGRDTIREVTGYRSGKLDAAHRLVDARAGMQNVFTQKFLDRADRMSVCLLVDESGSMSGNREREARDTAVLLSAALSGVRNVDVYIYGFTNTFTIYQEGGNAPCHEIGGIHASGGTPTGQAMLIAMDRVRKHTSDKTLMLVLTDGGADNDHRVHEACKVAEKKNFAVMGVGIGYDLSHLFKTKIQLSSMQSFSRLLGKTVKEALLNKTKRRTFSI